MSRQEFDKSLTREVTTEFTLEKEKNMERFLQGLRIGIHVFKSHEKTLNIN